MFLFISRNKSGFNQSLKLFESEMKNQSFPNSQFPKHPKQKYKSELVDKLAQLTW